MAPMNRQLMFEIAYNDSYKIASGASLEVNRKMLKNLEQIVLEARARLLAVDAVIHEQMKKD